MNLIGLWTLVKREMKRSFQIINQVIWPPIISTLLYVFVFGLALGSRIKGIQGVSYAQFLLPGLVMMQVIDGAYGESSSSIFQARFTYAIQEMLIAPMSAGEIVFGYVFGSVLRTFLIANVIMVLGLVLLHTVPASWGLYVLVLLLVAVLFAALGIIFGLMAEKYDNIAVLTTFAITPLVFVGGVFTSIHLLPPVVAHLSLLNPIFYTIDAFRYSYTGQSDVGLAVSLPVVAALTAAAYAIAYAMVRAGYKLRA
ncbi:ABC transporter permease [bacterium]|nr:MAG: ABC transporter permease [bacterium]